MPVQEGNNLQDAGEQSERYRKKYGYLGTVRTVPVPKKQEIRWQEKQQARRGTKKGTGQYTLLLRMTIKYLLYMTE